MSNLSLYSMTKDYEQAFLALIDADLPGDAIADTLEALEGELTDRGVYSYDNYYGFCAGSYGGYNGWRESLAKMAGYPSGKYEQYGKDWDSHCVACWEGQLGPFSELINFSDCEGAIGAKVAAKLAQDFAEHQQKVDAHPDDRFRRLYGEWRKAFEMAKDNGAVHFH